MGATLRFLADTTRLQILQLLLKRELCVCELTEQLEMSQPLMSYHLRKLRDAGLVRTRRKAQWIYYSIDPAAWQGLLAPCSPATWSPSCRPRPPLGPAITATTPSPLPSRPHARFVRRADLTRGSWFAQFVKFSYPHPTLVRQPNVPHRRRILNP